MRARLTLISSLALVLGVKAFDRQALATWFVGLDPDKVILAINCGSNEEITDTAGVSYQPVRTTVLIHFRIRTSLEVKPLRVALRSSGPFPTVRHTTQRDGETSSISSHCHQTRRVLTLSFWSFPKSISKSQVKRSSTWSSVLLLLSATWTYLACFSQEESPTMSSLR